MENTAEQRTWRGRGKKRRDRLQEKKKCLQRMGVLDTEKRKGGERLGKGKFGHMVCQETQGGGRARRGDIIRRWGGSPLKGRRCAAEQAQVASRDGGERTVALIASKFLGGCN